MVMGGYPQDLPGVMKLLNNYIAYSVNNRNFSKTSIKYQARVALTQTQCKDEKYKEKDNIKGGITFYTAEINIIGKRVIQI